MTPDRFTQARAGARPVTYDAGLRAHMSRVYNRMTLGVLVTAITSYVVASSPALLQLFLGGPQAYIIIFAPLAVLWFGFNPMTMSSTKLRLSFFAIALLYGISFATIFMAYTEASIARAFFTATGMFAGLSIYGYTTKKDLSGLGTFAIMGVIGVLVLSIINLGLGIFTEMDLTGMSNIIAGIGILAFSGVTAWQTQATKEMYQSSATDEANSRMAWSSALTLYIAFIAIFQYLLHFMGNRQ